MSSTVWAVTFAALFAVLIIDLAIAVLRRNTETSFKEAGIWTVIYVCAAIIFGISMGQWSTSKAQSEFFAGWITEYSLSIDNLFIFIIILARLKIAKSKEQLVLLVGIVMALVLRGIFIFLGAAAVERYTWVFFIFGAFLLFTAIKLQGEDDHEWKEGRLILWLRKRGSSPVTIALFALAFTDLIFALDSIPAIFGLTKDPYIVFTANVFALMGLRQLYFLIGGLMKRLIYLAKGLSIILAFIGVKLIIEAFHGIDIHILFGIHIPEISTQFSLAVILVTLAITTITSLIVSGKRGNNKVNIH
jgi:tellurite resistance protein TerC